MNRLSNKKIVITGAASGIGRAAAALMVAEGAQVLIADLNEGAADAAAAEIGTDGPTGRAVGTAVDVMDEGSMAAMIDRAVGEFGGIDVLCNHVGGSNPRKDLDLLRWISTSGIARWSSTRAAPSSPPGSHFRT
jgi:NAD(P)-dependent dehydrogenase (short-subunit alcohol dehydrogenase family)